MSKQVDFETEIIIDEKGKVNIRNCSQDMVELLYQLNSHDLNIQKRMKLIQRLEKDKEVTNECTM